MAAIIANKVKRERGNRNAKAALGTSTIGGPLKSSGKIEEESHQNVRSIYLKKIENPGPNDLTVHVNSSTNLLLYLGLGLASVGLIITFMGIGEKGFRTTHLKTIGPCIMGIGILFTCLRILICFLPCRKKYHRETQDEAEVPVSISPFVIPFEEIQQPGNGINFEKYPKMKSNWKFEKFQPPEYDIEIKMLPNLAFQCSKGKSKLKEVLFDGYGSDSSSEFSINFSRDDLKR